MNLIRFVISVFVGLLVVVAAAGWIWAGDHASTGLHGARVVLAMCALSAVGCLWLLWKEKPAST